MHFMAHRRLFCVFRHSFTLPNEPWPRSLITTYWFGYALPLASERSDTVLVLRNSSSSTLRRAALRADEAALGSLVAGASVEECVIPPSVPFETPQKHRRADE